MDSPERAAAGQIISGRDVAGGEIAALCDAARNHMGSGRYLEAQLCCQQSLALDARHADTLYLMGLLCLHLRQHDHAVAWLTRAIGEAPNTLYLTTLGTALLQQGEAKRRSRLSIVRSPSSRTMLASGALAVGLAMRCCVRPMQS
jgi:tetratricopeptide (TPR) repeat protein